MFSFDDLGYLMPYTGIISDVETFHMGFVGSFPESETRAMLFECYLQYNTDLQKILQHDYYQYVNGSFTTTKRNPKDIDLVNFVDYEAIKGKENILEQQFLTKGAMNAYGIDAYLVVVYPEAHSFRSRTLSDIAYWNHWFGFSKFDRNKKRSLKGFLQLSFKQPEK